MNAKGDEPHFEGAQFFLGAGEQGELLSSRYDDQGRKVLEALSRAIMLLANDSDIALTLHQVSESLSPGDKEEVFDLATEVAAVDAHLDEGELKALDLVGHILGLTQDAVHTRLRALRSRR